MATQLSCKTASQLYTIYCPFSVFCHMCGTAKSVYNRGAVFDAMERDTQKKANCNYPRTITLSRNKLMLEMRRDSTEKYAKLQRCVELLENVERGVQFFNALQILWNNVRVSLTSLLTICVICSR